MIQSSLRNNASCKGAHSAAGDPEQRKCVEIERKQMMEQKTKRRILNFERSRGQNG